MKQKEKDSTVGTVASRECPLCGHHEIGFVTQNGEFHALRTGTLIRVVDAPPPIDPIRDKPESPIPTEEEERAGNQLWMPEPLRVDKALRKKYGVMVKGRLPKAGMSGKVYELAYLEKLERLIDKELDVPIPAILDRFFNVPQLASGNPRQIAEAMYRELDEVMRPVQLVRDWLERKEDQSLANLVAPKALEALGQEPADDAQVQEELQGLTLKEFLEML